MAPTDVPDHNVVEQQVKDIIQDLFQVMVQVSTYDTAGRPSRDVLAGELETLSRSLAAVHRTATTALRAGPHIPEPLVSYVENGRNPDIYTREFVELVRRMNQLARGKQRAFAGFRDVLAREMRAALPELAGDVDAVVRATGGPEARGPDVRAEAEGGAEAGHGANGANGS